MTVIIDCLNFKVIMTCRHHTFLQMDAAIAYFQMNPLNHRETVLRSIAVVSMFGVHA